MAAILGLDIGTKRIGVAIADSDIGVAVPIGTFSRAQGMAEKAILALITEKRINTIVVGLPHGANQEASIQFGNIEGFARRLEKRTTAQIVYCDEFYSSHEAEDKLREKGRKLTARKKPRVDALAASIILDNYLKGLAANKG